MNGRPFTDAKTQEALNVLAEVYRYYDLAGAAVVVNAQEWGYGYFWEATWNAMVTDPDLPMQPGLETLGFRIRAKEAELGRDRAQELVTGSAFLLTSLKDFGTQTQLWAQDLIKMLRKNGIQITHKPFNGQRLPRILGMDMHA